MEATARGKWGVERLVEDRRERRGGGEGEEEKMKEDGWGR